MSTPYPMLQEAVRWAAKRHTGQYRDEDGLPYFLHVAEVILNLRQYGGVESETLLTAAALHDLVEMAAATPEEIEARFGNEVAALVAELTRTEPTEGQIEGLNRDQIWRLRADMLLKEIAEMSPDAQTVKLADRLANLREALAYKKGKKLARYLDHTRAILKIIPKNRNTGLWQSIQTQIKTAEKN